MTVTDTAQQTALQSNDSVSPRRLPCQQTCPRWGRWLGAVALASGVAYAGLMFASSGVAHADTDSSSSSSSSDAAASAGSSAGPAAPSRQDKVAARRAGREAARESAREAAAERREATRAKRHAAQQSDTDPAPAAESGTTSGGGTGRADVDETVDSTAPVVRTPFAALRTRAAQQTTPVLTTATTTASDSRTSATVVQLQTATPTATTSGSTTTSTTPTFMSMLAAWSAAKKNQAPTMPSKTVTIVIPTKTSVSKPISFGATDPEGDTLTYTVAAKGAKGGPKYGTVTIDQATGTFTYDPDDTKAGTTFTDTFTVTVIDSGAKLRASLFQKPTGTTSTMTLNIEPANGTPTANGDFYSVIANSPVIGNVLANDTDPEGQQLTATVTTGPSHGTVNFHADGSFTYTPDTNWTGTDKFSYIASDGVSNSVVADVKLMVATVPSGGKTPSIGIQGITWWSGLSDADTARALDMAKAEGITSMRIDISWYVVEYNKGAYDYSLIDPVVDAMASRNITVLGMLYGTPSWLSGTTDPSTAPTTAAGRQAFATFAAATAQHYLGEIDTWEIWNEPNLPRFWPVPDATQYAQLLKAAYPAIKAVSPTSTVITGGLSPDSSGIDPVTFVRAMYAAGAGGYFDAVGLHPYAFPYLPSLDPITAVHDVMVANGDGAKQIWLTEVGAPTGTSPWAETEDMQAQTIQLYVDFARNNSYVGPIFLYSLLDTGTDPANAEDNFGLLRRDFTPKEAWGVWL